jgi:hypothetical protein
VSLAIWRPYSCTVISHRLPPCGPMLRLAVTSLLQTHQLLTIYASAPAQVPMRSSKDGCPTFFSYLTIEDIRTFTITEAPIMSTSSFSPIGRIKFTQSRNLDGKQMITFGGTFTPQFYAMGTINLHFFGQMRIISILTFSCLLHRAQTWHIRQERGR